jgi:SAM-dependent methyltransferase
VIRLRYLWAQWRHGKADKDPTFRVAPAIEVLRTVGQLPREATVLDLGCRNRIEPDLLGAAGWRVTAVDLWPRMRGIRRADFHALPFPDGSYDAVMASHCLEHAHTPALALKEVCRVLRPGGLLWAAWPTHFVPNAHDRIDYGSAAAFVMRLPRPSWALWEANGPTESRVLVRVA